MLAVAADTKSARPLRAQALMTALRGARLPYSYEFMRERLSAEMLGVMTNDAFDGLVRVLVDLHTAEVGAERAMLALFISNARRPEFAEVLRACLPSIEAEVDRRRTLAPAGVPA